MDFANRRVTTQEEESFQTKDYERKVIGMTNRLYERHIARLARRGTDKYVFPNRRGGPNSHIDRIVERLAKRAGVSLEDKQVLHALRKTWATKMSDNGMSVVNIQKILGHSSLETTQRYLCTTNPDDPKLRAIQEAATGD